MTSTTENIDWQKGGGLLPAIVQHAVTGRVLMLGYMNAEALVKSRSSGFVTFYSRSRRCLWTKGETSGNKLELREIELDCDGDTFLVQATPIGPTCHLDKSSCFDRNVEHPGFGFIGSLETIISDRAKHQPGESYTVNLMKSGTQRIAQKVGEEGVEVALAAMSGDRDELVSETADMIYHVLVLLRSQDLNFADVAQRLERRHNGSDL